MDYYLNRSMQLMSVLQYHLPRLPYRLFLKLQHALIKCIWLIQRRKGRNANFIDPTAADEALSIFDSSSQNGHSKSGRSLCDECKELEIGICTEEAANTESPVFPSATSSGKAADVRRQPVDVDYSNYIGPKIVPPVGGRVRILRHLRCEVAYVVDKYCKGKPKAVMTFEQFELLYELEMGHPLVTSHYGFANLKSILQSMPDLLSVRNVAFDAADWRIFPYVKVNFPSPLSLKMAISGHFHIFSS